MRQPEPARYLRARRGVVRATDLRTGVIVDAGPLYATVRWLDDGTTEEIDQCPDGYLDPPWSPCTRFRGLYAARSERQLLLTFTRHLEDALASREPVPENEPLPLPGWTPATEGAESVVYRPDAAHPALWERLANGGGEQLVAHGQDEVDEYLALHTDLHAPDKLAARLAAAARAHYETRMREYTRNRRVSGEY